MKTNGILCVAGALLSCGCSIPIALISGYPLDSTFDSNVTLFERQKFGLKVGHQYRLRKPHIFYCDGERIGRLPTGTTVVINSVYRWNSITQGYLYHLRATVNGENSNAIRIEIHADDAPLFEELPTTGR